MSTVLMLYNWTKISEGQIKKSMISLFRSLKLGLDNI